MIESIKIKNFLSFKDEQEISFVASREISTSQSKQESWFTEIGGTRLLKMLVFIGNNGAGKTNALSAISYLRHLAVNSYSDKEENQPISLSYWMKIHVNNPQRLLCIII